MLDVDMNCDQSERGWFEVKGVITNNTGNTSWEFNIQQPQHCAGNLQQGRPYDSVNHMGKCGTINVFEFNRNECIINTWSE